MSQNTIKKTEWTLASICLDDAFTDFILSRQAMLCKPSTLRFYQFTTGRFVRWLKENSITDPDEITARHVRAYLAELAGNGMGDSTIHGHARAVKTLVRFFHNENYKSELITFVMPSIDKKRLLVLSVDDLQKVINACQTPRDKAMILLMVDSGIRRSEALALNWSDLDMSTGLVRIEKGNGGKYRTVVIGATTRRVLLAYRRTVCHEPYEPLIQSRFGTRLSPNGLRSAFMRIEDRAGVRVTPHALRRTFATLSRRSGMDLMELQALMGHASLDMTRRYIEMLDEDLLDAHRQHGPIDRLSSDWK